MDLLMAMLRFNPEARITAEEALEHPYFNEIKQKGYIHAYKANNQHLDDNGANITATVGADQSTSGLDALNPIPLNADLEKISESSENLKRNVSCLDFFLSMALSSTI